MRKNLLNTLPLLLCAGSLMLSAASSEAVVLVRESFDYTTGSNLVGANGGTGWTTGSSWQAASGLTPISTSVGTNGATIEGGAVIRTLGTALTSSLSSTYYIGFTIDNLGTGSRHLSVALFNGSTELVYAGQANNSARWGLDGAASALESRPGTGTDHPAVRMVLKLEYNASGNETFSLYINPIGDLEANNTAVLTNTAKNFSQFDTIRLAAFATNGSQTTVTGLFEDFVVATTFAEAAQAVPEPSRALLLCASMSLLFIRRRRA